MGKFKFGDKTTEDFGLVIQTPPTYSYPERDLSTVHVPGRNGDLIVDNKCYKNVNRAYLVALEYKNNKNYYQSFEKILEWLNSGNGKYIRLEDTYDSEVYRLAYFQQSGDFIDYFEKAGAATFTFKCKPQRFLKSAEVEREILFDSNVATITNISEYAALSKWRFSDLTSEIGEINLISIKDNNNNENIITIEYLDDSVEDVIIDSEEQRIYDNNGNDLSDKVGLNGKDFPYLSTIKNTVTVKKYEKLSSGIINSYNNIINDYILKPNEETHEWEDSNIVYSRYKEQQTLIDENKREVVLDSLENLILNKQETYGAESVQSLMKNRSERTILENGTIISGKYIFKSINDLLNEKSETWENGSPRDTDSENFARSWLSVDPDSGKVIIKETGFYIVSTDSSNLTDSLFTKYIVHLSNGTIIVNSLSETEDFSITRYPDKLSGSEYDLDIEYDLGDVDWLSAKFIYAVKNGIRYVDSVSFNAIRNGYYHINGNGINILGLITIGSKDSWNHIVASDSSPKILDSLNWNAQKTSFVSRKGLKTTSDATFEYRFLKDLPQYENGEVEKVYFRIDTNDDSAAKISIYPTELGFYSYKVNDNQQSAWIDRTTDASLNTPITGSNPINGTDTFIIYFIKNPEEGEPLLTYKKDDTWPDWLNPIPYYLPAPGAEYKRIDDAAGLNANNIYIKTGMYTSENDYLYSWTFINDKGEQEYTKTWEPISSDETIENPFSRTNNGFKIASLEKEQPDYSDSHNREYSYNGKTETVYDPNQPLPWFGTIIQDKDSLIKYFALKPGFYKWDNNERFIEITEEDSDKYIESKYERVFGESPVGNIYGIVYAHSAAGGIDFEEEDTEDDVIELITSSIVYHYGDYGGYDLLEDGDFIYVYIKEHATLDDIVHKERIAKFKIQWDSPVHESGDMPKLIETIDEYKIDLFSTEYKDDTVIMYMDQLPSYETGSFIGTKIDLVPFAKDGSPEGVSYIVLTAGYYRTNYENNWKYYEENQEILTSEIDETNEIHTLNFLSDYGDETRLFITPRWWLL